MDIEEQATDTTRDGPAAQARQYIELGWEGVDHPHKESLLLLYTRGRKSGRYRRTPLVYHLPASESIVLVANNGGRATHPDWYFNLNADPTVWIRNRDDLYEAVATTLEGQDRELAWSRITDHAPHFAESQAKVERTIPLVRITQVGN